MTLSEITEDINMTNGTDPSGMTHPERMAEVSMLLSLAMMRLWLKRRGQARSAGVDERGFSREGVTIALPPSRNNRSV
jgi:hypothetical protein